MNVRTVLAAALLATAGASCSPREQPEPPPPRPVRTLTVGLPEGASARTFSGRARPAVGTMLSFRVGGEISELPAKIGLAVRAGDVIARLDPTDYEMRVRQLDAQRAQADAQEKQAAADYERTRSLYEAGNASRSELDRARALAESARAQKDAAAQGLDLARQQLEYCTLRAPLDGTVTAVPTDVHALVQPGTPVAGLSAGDAMEIETGVPEAVVGSLNAGQRARVSFESLPGREFAAEVTEVGTAANDVTTYPVRLALAGKDPRILAGMVCEVAFDSPDDRAALAVPAAAVVGAPGGGAYVWVVDPATLRVHRRDVVVGPLSASGLQISSGLGAGDIIAIRGVHQLEEGMAVRLRED